MQNGRYPKFLIQHCLGHEKIQWLTDKCTVNLKAHKQGNTTECH